MAIIRTIVEAERVGMKEHMLMNLDIRSKDHDLSPELTEMIRTRVERNLAASRDRVGRVVVQLSDENGPRGGVDTRCSVLVRLVQAPDVHVQSLAESTFQAVAHATRRAGQAVDRVFNRERDLKRQRS